MNELIQNDLKQAFVYNYPTDKICGILVQGQNNRWIPYHSCLMDQIKGLPQALEDYERTNSEAQLVEYSRYLVDGELVVIRILKQKKEVQR